MEPTVTFKDSSSKFINKYFSYIRGKSIENPNVTKSLIFHVILILVVSGMIPTCSRKIEKPTMIAVSIMPLGEAPKTTPKAEQQPIKKEEPKKEEPKPLPPKDVKKPADATKMEKADKPKPVAKPEDKKPSPKKEEKKPEPEKKLQDEQKKDDRDQDGKKRLLKDLEKKDQEALEDIFDEAAKADPKAEPKPAQASGKTETIADPALVNEIMSKIQSQVSQNWNIPIGIKDIENLQVRLFIALTPQGAVTNVKILDQVRYSTDSSYRLTADTAVWAVKESSPFQGLPADKYDLWKEIEFTFDPRQAL